MKPNFTLLVAVLLLFVSFTANAQVPTRAGWWKFDDPLDMMKAEIGTALIGTGTSVAGPVAGNNAIQVDLGSFLTMPHGISPNGGGTLVNEYSLLIDFSVPATGIWHAFFQTEVANTGDADLFTNSSTNAIGTGATGYTSKGISVDTWYRLIVTVKNGEFFKIYVNGILWLDGVMQDIDGRFALANELLLFADNDGDDEMINCSEAAIWDVALDADQVTAMGDASGNRSRVRTKMGSWKFDDALDMTKAEIGSPLVLTGTQTSVAGPETGNLATQIGVGSYLSMAHGIGLNGSDTLVNEYSVQIDFSVPATGIWHSFIQTDPTNLSDADLFTNTSNKIGTTATGYSTDAILPNTWYRMVISVKNGQFFQVYLNGELWVDALGQDVDGRFGLENALLLFADNDGEDGVINCSEVNIWEVALTADEVLALGSDPSDIGAPLELTGVQDFSNGPAVGNNATTIGVGSYLTMYHGIYPNGGGAMVNEYSLQFDFSIPQASIWHAFFQTDQVANGSDADLFINGGTTIPNTIGTATSGYSTNVVSANTWYRMIVTVKNGVFFKVYVNGDLWLDGAGQTIDDRWGLGDLLLIFADDDGDDGTIVCSELGIWDIALTADQVLKLGDALTTPATGIQSEPVSGRSSGLGQNYPNPFANATTFPYEVQKTGKVSFRIIDIAGNEVRVINEGVRPAGKYNLELNSENLNNGVYYLQMTSGERMSTRKMVVIK
jgi:hypothetical protein